MTSKEFFDTVVEMRKHQKAYLRSNGRDKDELRYSRDYEAKIDKEIVRVKLIIKENQNPRLDFG